MGQQRFCAADVSFEPCLATASEMTISREMHARDRFQDVLDLATGCVRPIEWNVRSHAVGRRATSRRELPAGNDTPDSMNRRSSATSELRVVFNSRGMRNSATGS